MAYTVKTTITLAPSLDLQTKIQKLGLLMNQGLVVDGYNQTAYQAYRASLQRGGAILNRFAEVSWADMALYVTTVWRTKDDYTAFSNNGLAIEYQERMRMAGYSVVISEVV